MSRIDHPAGAIDERLRAMSRLSERIDARTPRVEMSAGAIDRRLREASDLTAACLRLASLTRPRDGSARRRGSTEVDRICWPVHPGRGGRA